MEHNDSDDEFQLQGREDVIQQVIGHLQQPGSQGFAEELQQIMRELNVAAAVYDDDEDEDEDDDSVNNDDGDDYDDGDDDDFGDDDDVSDDDDVGDHDIGQGIGIREEELVNEGPMVLPIVVGNYHQLHAAMPHPHTRHLPPIDIAHFVVVCDCLNPHTLDTCCLQDNFNNIQTEGLDFARELEYAIANADDPLRDANNTQRRRMNGLLFHALDWAGGVERGERRPLPNCAVAKIRSIYPSDTGLYMGFKAARLPAPQG